MDINLKKIRKEQGKKLKDVCADTGMCITLISMCETKTPNRTVKMVEKVANSLGYELTLKKKDED